MMLRLLTPMRVALFVAVAMLLGVGTGIAALPTPAVGALVVDIGLGGIHVGTNAALQAFRPGLLQALASAVTPTTVRRDGFYAAGDGGGADYVYASAACSAPDNGAQVVAAAGGCWMAVLPAGAADWRIWGADPTGTRDSTAAIQAALNSGASLDVYGAPGTYKACGLVMPSTFGMRLRGAGTATKLVQGACGAPLIAWAQTGIAYTEGTISDLSFDGTLGGADTIDTRGVGGLTLRHLYFGNLPVGYSGILVDGVGSTAMHDDRLNDIQFYSATAGRSGIHFGAHATDSSAHNVIGNGEFVVQDGIAIDNGAVNIVVSHSHPYNVTRSNLYVTGCQTCQFNDVTLDNSRSDTAYLANVYNTTFTGAYFEAIAAGKCGANLVNSSAVSFVNSTFQANVGTASAVCEGGTSDYNTVLSGNIGAVTNYSKVFNFIGPHSYSKGVPGVTPLGITYSFSGATTSALASGSTSYLGINGAQSGINATAFMAPQTAIAQSATIQTDSTPASGQTFTFTVYDGNTALGSGTIAPGSYGTTIALNNYVTQNDLIYITAVFSSSSGSANVRYTMSFSG